MADDWIRDSNFLVVVAVPDEPALMRLTTSVVEEGIAHTLVREPDLDGQATALAIEPGDDARRLCANLPLALKEPVMT